MRRSHAFLVLAVLVGVACTASPAPEAGKHQLILRKQVVVDQQGLGYEAFRMLVPKDWSFAGGITWNFGKFPPEAHTAYTVTSPDGRAVIESFPALNLYFSPDPMMQQSFAQSGSTIMQPMQAEAFLKNVYISHVRADASGVKIVDSQPLPDLARHALEVNQFMMNLFGQISPFRFPFELRADSARVKFEYMQGGKKMVEDVTATVDYFISSTTSMYGGVVQSVSWTPSVISFRAPAEEFDQRVPAYQIVIATHWDNPRYGVELTRLMATITREQLRQQQAIFNRMQQIHRTQEEISDMIYEGYQKRSAAYDRIFDNYSQVLRGVETYNDPVNKWNVELPTGYNSAWTNGIDYVFSDSASFDPNIGSTQNWQKMERKR
jgi:hypothetical protein